mmetsp:Transcript_25241/g.30373  ORF Transcript_25241/g.30373 Transcript_25241/m.30373 type:complete len:248 (+) Transcript_25241:35-778(+)
MSLEWIDCALQKACAECSESRKERKPAVRLTLLQEDRSVLTFWILCIGENNEIRAERNFSKVTEAEAKCTLRVFEMIAAKDLPLSRAALTGQLRVQGRNAFKQWQSFLRIAMDNFLLKKNNNSLQHHVLLSLQAFRVRCGKSPWRKFNSNLQRFVRDVLTNLGLPKNEEEAQYFSSQPFYICVTWKSNIFHIKARTLGGVDVALSTKLILAHNASIVSRRAIFCDFIRPALISISSSSSSSSSKFCN